MELTRLEKNLVFQEVEEASLNPRDFRWEKSKGDDLIVHIPTNRNFVFESPETGSVIAGGLSLAVPIFGTRAQMFRRLRRWLALVAEDFNTPDMWATLAEEKFWGNDDGDNSPFSAEEQAAITIELHQFTVSIKQRDDLSYDQIRRIEESVERLVEATKSSGRRDWAILFMSVVASWAFAAFVPGDVAIHAIQSVAHGVSQFYPPSAPQLPTGG